MSAAGFGRNLAVIFSARGVACPQHRLGPTMDRTKLDELRAKYANAAPGQSYDPEFRRITEKVFAGTDRRPKPYEGVSTFLGTPLQPGALAEPDLGGLDVALVGVPMDLGVTNRAGARLGPRAVRSIERMGPY